MFLFACTYTITKFSKTFYSSKFLISTMIKFSQNLSIYKFSTLLTRHILDRGHRYRRWRWLDIRLWLKLRQFLLLALHRAFGKTFRKLRGHEGHLHGLLGRRLMLDRGWVCLWEDRHVWVFIYTCGLSLLPIEGPSLIVFYCSLSRESFSHFFTRIVKLFREITNK